MSAQQLMQSSTDVQLKIPDMHMKASISLHIERQSPLTACVCSAATVLHAKADLGGITDFWPTPSPKLPHAQ